MILVLDGWPPQISPFQVVLDGVGGTIGSAADNDVVLPDLPVSPYHADVVYEEDVYYVRDSK